MKIRILFIASLVLASCSTEGVKKEGGERVEEKQIVDSLEIKLPVVDAKNGKRN